MKGSLDSFCADFFTGWFCGVGGTVIGWLLVTLLLSSCGKPRVDHALDFEFRSNFVSGQLLAPIDPQAIKRLIYLTAFSFADETGELDAEILHRLESKHPKLVIWLYDGIFSCPSADDPTKMCLGQTNLVDKISLAWAERLYTTPFCEAYTSLAHEFIHLFAWDAFEDPDSNHDDLRLFGPNSATYLANAMFRKLYC